MDLEYLRVLSAGGIPYCPQKPTDKQREFLAFDDLEVLYGGAVGGAKSSAILMGALQYADRPHYDALILRKTYQDLAKAGAIMDRAKQWLIPQGIKWNDKDKRFQFASGATLSFGYLQNANDIYQYQSSEFQFIGWDELTQFPEQSYRFLFSRLRRAKGSDVPLRMRAASNPGGLGHAWVNRRFIDKETATAKFLSSKLEDNPHIDREEYELSLAQLDAVTRKQLREGIWVQDSAGLVYPHYDPKRNGWPSEAAKFDFHLLAIDYGFIDECAFVVYGWRNHDPSIYILSSEKLGKMTPSKAAEHAQTLEDQYHFCKIVADVGGLGKGYAEEARLRFSLPIEPAEKNNKRGYQDLFNGDMERGRIKVHPTCTGLIKEWAELPWNEGHTKESDGFDNHEADGALYGFRATTAYHNIPVPKPKDPMVQMHEDIERHWQDVGDRNLRNQQSEWWNEGEGDRAWDD